MKKFKLDKEELAQMKLSKKPGWTSVSQEMKSKIVEAARNSIESRKKEARTNIRLETRDFEGIKKKAADRGIGYQTLIASIVHMYVNDQLLEIDEAKKALGVVENKKAEIVEVVDRHMERTQKRSKKTKMRKSGTAKAG